MLSPCRGCSPPPPGPSPSARRKSMLAARGDPLGRPGLAAPHVAPRRRSRPGGGGWRTSPGPHRAPGRPGVSGRALGQWRLLVSSRSRPALATNFAQVSCAAALLSARSWERAPAESAASGAPLSSPLRPEPSRRRGRGAGGELRKTRHHLSSQVRAGAAPALPTPAAQGGPAQPRPPSAPAQVSVATCVCARPEPALGVHVQPRLCVYIWGPAEEVEPGTPGGRRDQRSRLPLPHPQDLELTDPLRPPPLPNPPPPTPFHLRAGLGEWRVRSAPRSLRTVWRWQPLVSSGYPGRPGAQLPRLRPWEPRREEEGGGHE
ncbi:uncharacterized protein LOC103879407 [Papio anubis]|uniref:uncharacterized protein LOC103879407 n=1 Tax=Papio anubis TaxID=9555 RepID=UPI0012AD48CC|nr:uncharacterized protein LOC103879407 [Papio anubis]